eukprot:CAMPEP_0204304632 /NCGR_PEP_ID=MMETSP0468-20130131/84512_1 /ASSEMBLY_ACC=CAM_ASM_000383 /TAXON_ID=2969 /ORGANISM="Oxyrrhis marina" /LENGTH=108 /DNA_ID=CAMNT_0051283959 /DNA_START=262 /DNA_END=588 /DNA_ORIENTATION=-
MLVNLPFKEEIILPTALAAPVVAEMMFWCAHHPARLSSSPRDRPCINTSFAVVVCTVVINPSTTPNLSCTTSADGAKQYLEHDALETTERKYPRIMHVGYQLAGIVLK